MAWTSGTRHLMAVGLRHIKAVQAQMARRITYLWPKASEDRAKFSHGCSTWAHTTCAQVGFPKLGESHRLSM